jgi:hypothetical protein
MTKLKTWKKPSLKSQHKSQKTDLLRLNLSRPRGSGNPKLLSPIQMVREMANRKNKGEGRKRQLTQQLSP